MHPRRTDQQNHIKVNFAYWGLLVGAKAVKRGTSCVGLISAAHHNMRVRAGKA